MDVPFFNPEEFLAFHPTNYLTKSPLVCSLQTAVKSKLLGLHGLIHPHFHLYNLDLHPHWQKELIVCDCGLMGQTRAVTTHLDLAYGKSHSQLKRTLRSFAHPVVDDKTFWQSPLLTLRVDYIGLHIALVLGEKAWLEATNLRNKVQYNLVNQRNFLQLLNDLFIFGFRLKDTFEAVGLGKEATPAQVLQLVRTFQDTNGQLYVSRTYGARDPRLDETRITLEVMSQVRLLYPLYRFVCWRPDNHYLEV